MARLIVQGERFDSKSSYAFLEKEYERVILKEAPKLFPETIAIPFNTPIVSDGVQKRPDIALIAPDLRCWWVVEIELAHHSLYDHVLPQVEVFANGAYGRTHAEAICKALPDLDIEAVRAMMRGAQPEVLVVVNQPVPDWVKPLEKVGAKTVIVEIFHSKTNLPVYRINGHELEVPSTFLTTCRVDKRFPRMLLVDAPATLPQNQEEGLEIIFEGAVTTWKQFSIADRTWLRPDRNNPVSAAIGTEMRIVQTTDGQMALELEEPTK